MRYDVTLHSILWSDGKLAPVEVYGSVEADFASDAIEELKRRVETIHGCMRECEAFAKLERRRRSEHG